jgi:hypothetical protein
MTAFIRFVFILGFVGMAAAIAPIAQAETETGDREGSEILNSDTLESAETVAIQSEEDAVMIAEVEGESSEVSAESSNSTRTRTPLTSRIFPCSSMEQ